MAVNATASLNSSQPLLVMDVGLLLKNNSSSCPLSIAAEISLTRGSALASWLGGHCSCRRFTGEGELASWVGAVIVGRAEVGGCGEWILALGLFVSKEGKREY